MKELTERTYRAIYRLLDRVSPLDTDCGALCSAACCTSSYEDGEEMGILKYDYFVEQIMEGFHKAYRS